MNVHDDQAPLALSGWCTGVTRSLCSTHGQVQTKGPVSLSVTMVKILEWVSGHVGGAGQGETNCDTKDYTPTFPFKVDQFKSDIKIRNNQVKKNTAKGYSIYIQ